MRKIATLTSLFFVAALFISACNLPQKTPSAPAGQADPIGTAAAQTVIAMTTQLANPTQPATSEPVENTATSAVVDVPTNTAPPPTQTPSPAVSNTPPAPTATSVPCDRAGFVSEKIPDDSAMTPGQTFTKVWTLKNSGSCTWNSSYSVVFVSGDAMSAPASIQLTTGSVAPGATIDISIDMKAPTKAGKYKGTWQLRNGAGVLFGLGDKADKDFWVQIQVSGAQYDFIGNVCKAEWKNSSGDTLPCPGNLNDAKGFAIRVENPHLENGATDDEPALWTNPQMVNNGEITGKYPAIVMTSGSHFKTVIGCQYGATNCNVKFNLSYIADNGSLTSLSEWTETYDNKFTQVDLDLSSLAGKSVQFVLIVKANGSADGDQAFWLKPRIE